MIKCDEETDPTSCWNKAQANEMTFVLLGRDPAAPLAIREWIRLRILLRKNHAGDPQMVEAEKCAQAMVAQKVLKGGGV